MFTSCVPNESVIHQPSDQVQLRNTKSAHVANLYRKILLLTATGPWLPNGGVRLSSVLARALVVTIGKSAGCGAAVAAVVGNVFIKFNWQLERPEKGGRKPGST